MVFVGLVDFGCILPRVFRRCFFGKDRSLRLMWLIGFIMNCSTL